jgi:hypothetical protein
MAVGGLRRRRCADLELSPFFGSFVAVKLVGELPEHGVRPGDQASRAHVLGEASAASTADAPNMTALGAASASFQMLGPVSLQQVLEVVAEFNDSGGASLGLVAWELCVDQELVAPAWQQAISHGLMSPAARDWQEQLWRLSSTGRAAARSERRSS